MDAAEYANGMVPQHVAIIMDGNGRWASARGLKRGAGHRQGAEAVKRTIEAAVTRGVRYLTLFSFSSENWKRPEAEITDLMGLLRFYLAHEVDFLKQHDVRFQCIGDRAGLAADIVALVQKTERQTADNRALTLIVALNYGARAEIAGAARRLAESVGRGEVRAEEIDEEMLGRFLETHGIPDPDMIIRTSGEQRVSNFLLWQAAYSEFVFVETLWPDFSQGDLDYAIREFNRRERRFGAVAR